jgi:hypothetical protein
MRIRCDGKTFCFTTCSFCGGAFVTRVLPSQVDDAVLIYCDAYCRDRHVDAQRSQRELELAREVEELRAAIMLMHLDVVAANGRAEQALLTCIAHDVDRLVAA